MGVVKTFVTGSKVLGAVVAVLNVRAGKSDRAAEERAIAALFNIPRAAARQLTPQLVLNHSLRTIHDLIPPEMASLGDALSGLCTMLVRSATDHRLVISYEFLKYVFGKALADDTILSYLRQDPQFKDGDLTPEDVISMLYTASPALADAIESLEDSPYNDPSSKEFAQLTNEYDKQQGENHGA